MSDIQYSDEKLALDWYRRQCKLKDKEIKDCKKEIDRLHTRMLVLSDYQKGGLKLAAEKLGCLQREAKWMLRKYINV